METMRLEITLNDGRTIEAKPRPEDDERLARLIADRSEIELGSSSTDVEGHALSSDVFVDVEGHAVALRLPTPADAASLRRAIAVGAVTAAIVGSGVIASVQPATRRAAPVSAPQAVSVPVEGDRLAVPAQALRADKAESANELRFQSSANADTTGVPAQALHADRAETQREQLFEDKGQ